MSLDDVYNTIKEPGKWGRITGVSYTIKNNEAGTIKPSRFMMIMEGYDKDDERIEYKFDVGIDSQRIKIGETVTDDAAIKATYNVAAMPDGDLKKVRINLILYDAENQLMASHQREVDLTVE